MKANIERIIGRWTGLLQGCLVMGQRLPLAALCCLLLVSGLLAHEERPEPLPTPEQSTPEAAATEKPPDPNETLPPSPQANQSVDGDIVFTSPGQFTYPRDIR